MSAARPDLDEDKRQALALTPVSHETLAALETYADLLVGWNDRMNLVATSTLPQLWTRHIADSLQLLHWAPEGQTWVDLGSGAGLPGLVLACALKGAPGACVHLVESRQRKSHFLAAAAQAADLPVVVHNARIEDIGAKLAANLLITARGLAPLPRLLELTAPFWAAGARGLFLKGQNVAAELTDVRESWKLDFELHPSVTNREGQVVDIRRARRR